MKRSLDPFRALPFLDLEERAESASCFDSDIYIGTAQGNLLQYEIAWGDPEDGIACPRKVGGIKLSPRRPVEQVHALGGIVAALVDGAVTVLPADIQAFQGTVLCREAKLFCPHTHEAGSAGGKAREICVCSRKKLAIYTHNGRSFEQSREFQAPDAALAMAWHGPWICVGFRREYLLFNERNLVPREVYRLDGKLAPQIAVVGNEMLLLAQESRALLLNLGTQQLSPQPLAWPRKVVRLGAAGGFALGSTGQGQVDVFSARDHRNCQTLALEGLTVSIISATGGRALVVAETMVTCLDLVPFGRQMETLLRQVRVSDALDLLNASFGAEDPERERQLGGFHARAGWALFGDLQFPSAFQHFFYANELNLAELLALWRDYLPSRVESADFKTPEDVAEADIKSFVKARLIERHGSEPSASAISANLEMANAGLVAFLLRQRVALLAEEKMPASERPKSPMSPTELLRAMDTVLLKLLVEVDQDEQRLQLLELLEGGVRCAVEDCEEPLRERKRLDVLARLWKEQGRHELVLKEWGALLAGLRDCSPAALETAQSLHVSPPQIVGEMCSALKGACATAKGAELLRSYVPALLEAEEMAVLPVFTAPVLPGGPTTFPLKAEEVCDLLEKHPKVALGFLEHLVASKRDVEAWHCARLASMYIAQVAEEQKGRETPTRGKLLKFLEETEGIDIVDLLPRVEALRLEEERVVLHSRKQQHEEALRIIVEELNDLARAEVYCRVVMANKKTGHVSLFAAEPPAWARAVAFGGKREEEDAAVEKGNAGARPLFVFLTVLLDASEKRAMKRSKEEYREAALALLTAYAGHVDLPPGEVVGILPADWPLECLAGYLSKAARICLHEQRVSMLEKKLSSMAYLKTFAALAQERSRKVTITGDRCCPVCNRRFVDKDSVGKAFVAYPNEVCVHLQCKEDLSVCPKTGVSFADNLSVYCNALGDSGEGGARFACGGCP